MLPFAITAIIAFAIGYVAGAMRTFAHCHYWGEGVSSILNTLTPYCGDWKAR